MDPLPEQRRTSPFRIGSTSTMKSYYYAGSTRVAMRTGSNTLNYLLGDHSLACARDRLGSRAINANSSGVKSAELRYYPWGKERYTSGTTPTNFKFTGQRQESSFGLYFYNSRWYDPALGRFIQADSIVPGAGNPQAYDRYAYSYGNPVKYTDPTGHEYCESEHAVAEDCEGIKEYLPDKACRVNADCYDAYTTYYQVVLLLGRAPTDKELLYMTAATEYWAYTDLEGVASNGQEALARNYFERCGIDGCTGSEIYRFLAGYQVWMGYVSHIDMNSNGRAADLVSAWNQGINVYISEHVETIINKRNTPGDPWTLGYDDNRPWQWFGPFPWDTTNKPQLSYSPDDDAILAIDLGDNQGFWMFTGAQDNKFNRHAWGPQEAKPE